MNSTVTISELQAQTPKIIRETERRGFTSVTRHGKIVAVMISNDRIEAMIESMELLSNPEFMAVLKDYKAGKLRFKEVTKDEH